MAIYGYQEKGKEIQGPPPWSYIRSKGHVHLLNILGHSGLQMASKFILLKEIAPKICLQEVTCLTSVQQQLSQRGFQGGRRAGGGGGVGGKLVGENIDWLSSTFGGCGEHPRPMGFWSEKPRLTTQSFLFLAEAASTVVVQGDASKMLSNTPGQRSIITNRQNYCG